MEIVHHMLRGNALVGSLDAVLKMAPEAFNRIRVNLAPDVFPAVMADSAVLVAFLGQGDVGIHFIRAHHRTLGHVFLDEGHESLLPGIRYDAGNDVTAALHHAEDNGLIRFGVVELVDPGVVLGLWLAAYISLVRLHMTRQATVAVDPAHILADLVTDAPGRLVGDAELALQLLGRDTMAGRGEQVHGKEPLLQRSPGALERGACHRVNVVSAPRTLEGRHLADLAELTVLPTFRAVYNFAVTQLHQVIQAGVIIRKTLEKILNGEVLGHVIPPNVRIV